MAGYAALTEGGSFRALHRRGDVVAHHLRTDAGLSDAETRSALLAPRAAAAPPRARSSWRRCCACAGSRRRASAPKRLVLAFTPDSHPPEWWPTGSGTSFTLNEPLADFSGLEPNLLFIQRLDHAWTFDNHHEAGMAQLFTGARFFNDTQRYANGPSIDQILLKSSDIRGGTPLASVHVSAGGGGGTDKRHVISYSGAGPADGARGDRVARVHQRSSAASPSARRARRCRPTDAVAAERCDAGSCRSTRRSSSASRVTWDRASGRSWSCTSRRCSSSSSSCRRPRHRRRREAARAAGSMERGRRRGGAGGGRQLGRGGSGAGGMGGSGASSSLRGGGVREGQHDRRVEQPARRDGHDQAGAVHGRHDRQRVHLRPHAHRRLRHELLGRPPRGPARHAPSWHDNVATSARRPTPSPSAARA